MYDTNLSHKNYALGDHDCVLTWFRW